MNSIKNKMTEREIIILDIMEKHGYGNTDIISNKTKIKCNECIKTILDKLVERKIVYKNPDNNYYIIKTESEKLMKIYNLKPHELRVLNILKQRSNKHKKYEGYIRIKPFLTTQICNELNITREWAITILKKLINKKLVIRTMKNIRAMKNHYFLTELYKKTYEKLYPGEEINIIEIPKDIPIDKR